MSPAFRRYVDQLHELRRAREEFGPGEEDLLTAAEEPIEEALDRIWNELTEAERDAARDETWRAWPDLYAKATATPHDVAVWSVRRGSPRAFAEARGCT